VPLALAPGSAFSSLLNQSWRTALHKGDPYLLRAFSLSASRHFLFLFGQSFWLRPSDLAKRLALPLQFTFALHTSDADGFFLGVRESAVGDTRWEQSRRVVAGQYSRGKSLNAQVVNRDSHGAHFCRTSKMSHGSAWLVKKLCLKFS